MEQMSANVSQNADNALTTKNIAMKSAKDTKEGGKAVAEAVEAVKKIAEEIRIIQEIARQTDLLALNAAMQAAMAGEAGRGFAVVADEVQRLAERSANATRQIEVLVNTIQSDTNEAMVSMERSTTDVVGGALLAENAGAALDEIESVSNQIASLVQNISSTSREQATAAGDMTRNMGVLREVSSQTAEATSATSDSIEKLAELAAQLRNSVAGFRLPDAPKRPSAPPAESRPRTVPAGPDLRSVGS